MSHLSTVNEKSSFVLSCTFKDKDGTAENPAASRYRIDNPRTKFEIRDWTSLSPTAGVVEITVNSSDNTLTQTNVLMEKRILTVDADYGSTSASSDGVKDTFSWEIKALEFLGSSE